MTRAVPLFLAVLAALAPAGSAAAQQAGTPGQEAPPGGPADASTSVVVDDEQAELERRQREAGAVGDGPADEVVVTPEPVAEQTPAESLHHGEQVSIRAGIAVPYVFAVKYAEGPRCDDEGETFCRRLGAALVDLEIGFGVSTTVELSLLARLGLADDEAAGANPLAFGFGARAYGSPHSVFKLFFGGRIVLDVTSSEAMQWKDFDVGLRGEFGLQVDFVRHAGVYVQLAPSVTFLRGLYFVPDVSGGVQARFP